MIQTLLTAIIGVALGAGIVIIAKLNLNAGWTNKEFDGTLFISVILFAFVLTMIGTYIKESFASLETTQSALDIYENLFMIIVGYLFKKAADATSNGSSNT